MRQPVEALVSPVAGGSGKYEGQIAGMAGLEEAPLQPDEQFVRRADPDETRYADRVAILDDGHGLDCREKLA